jgi:hypothetical protein
VLALVMLLAVVRPWTLGNIDEETAPAVVEPELVDERPAVA